MFSGVKFKVSVELRARKKSVSNDYKYGGNVRPPGLSTMTVGSKSEFKPPGGLGVLREDSPLKRSWKTAKIGL